MIISLYLYQQAIVAREFRGCKLLIEITHQLLTLTSITLVFSRYLSLLHTNKMPDVTMSHCGLPVLHTAYKTLPVG